MSALPDNSPTAKPFFPLAMVAFPGEAVRLHIFEPRYKQLMQEVEAGQLGFVLVPVLEKGLGQRGVEMQLREVKRRYPDGRLDVEVYGTELMEVVDFYPEVVGKWYPGGLVRRVPLVADGDPGVWQEILEAVSELWSLMAIDKPRPLATEWQDTFQIGHLLGLSLEQEHELLQRASERDRQAFLLEYLWQSLPVARAMAVMQHRARMNGQFRHFPPLSLPGQGGDAGQP